MRDGAFEWDDEKARVNIAKHKLSLEIAALAFDDPNGIDEPDDSDDGGEERYNWFGLVAGRVLVVTYCWRGLRIRIISARKGNKHDQEFYFSR